MLLFCVSSVFSQENDLLNKAQELIYSNPDEAIKIAEHALKNTVHISDKAQLNVILGKSYFTKGSYNKAANAIFKVHNSSPNIDSLVKIDISLEKAKILRVLYLDKQSQQHLNEAKKLVSHISEKSTKDSIQYLVALEDINFKLNLRQSQEALSAIQQELNNFKSFLNSHKPEHQKLLLLTAIAYKQLERYDLAEKYIDETLKFIHPMQINSLNEKAIIYKEIGELYLQEKKFNESEESLFIALRFAEIIQNPVLLMEINRAIAINYIATNQQSKHRVYNDEFLVLNNKVELMEQDAINTVFNLINSEDNQAVILKENTYKKYQNFLVFGLVILFIISVFMWQKSQGKKRRLQEIIKYLEISRNTFKKTKPKTKPRANRIVIPAETEKTILQKLKRFENSKIYLNKDMSLALLAGHFETNTKYLSEIINKHYNDNFNTFINKLRLNYIINKLKNDPNYINYKISFLAEESGYSSHSSFATVFKSIIGMSPATFINLIKEEREANKKKES
ncbi:helix-turn-helix domain-containing protein [Neotamlana sedimentorum]|nr:AraC family transcriptional regulator [Tamlana sedimentorum]